LNFLQLSRRLHSRVAAFAVPLLWRGAQSRHLLLRVNQNFELFSIFSSPAFSRFVASCSPVSWRDAETSEAVRSDKRNFQKSFIFSVKTPFFVTRPSAPRVRIDARFKMTYRPRMPMGTGSAGGCASRYRFTATPRSSATIRAASNMISWLVSFMRRKNHDRARIDSHPPPRLRTQGNSHSSPQVCVDPKSRL
jgi:hypothetical protein